MGTIVVKIDVVDANDFAAVGVDDLLIEEIARYSQHVFIGMIGGEALVLEVNTGAGDAFHLVVTDRKPAGTGADEKAVDAHRIDKGDKRGIAQSADMPAFQVVNLEAEEFG